MKVTFIFRMAITLPVAGHGIVLLPSVHAQGVE